MNKAIFMSYLRSVLGATLALVMAGYQDPKELGFALLAAFAPVILRALDPNDPAFGRMPKEADFEAAMNALKKED